MTIQGYQLRITAKNPVRLATTGNIADLAAGAPNTVDGTGLVVGDRILVWQQGAGATNGVYRVVTVGGGANGSWVRDEDFDSVLYDSIQAGLSVYVQDGATYTKHVFHLVTTGAITLGVTALVFEDLSSSSGTLENVIYVDKGTDPWQTGSIAHPFHTIAGALAVAVSGDVVFIMPGTYVESGLTPVSGVTLRGLSRAQVTLNAGAGIALMVLGAGETVAFEDLTVIGSIDINSNGSGAILHRVVLYGIIDIQSGNASTQVTADDCVFTGDASDLRCVRFADADPIVSIKNTYMVGRAANVAVYWDSGITNNNLKLAYSTVMHGSGGANNPFGRDVAQTPTYVSHHCAYNSDPESGALWTNSIAVGQRYDSLDPGVGF